MTDKADTLDNLALVSALAEWGRSVTRQIDLGEITPTNSMVLLLMSIARNAPTRPTDLMSEVGLTSGRISQMLNDLEAAGFITRRTSQADGRVRVVELTESGVGVTDAIGGAFARSLNQDLEVWRHFHDLFASLPPPDDGR